MRTVASASAGASDVADVIVVGGGIAGASAAMMLGRAGLSVELYEQHTFPRDKACAEGLMPAGVAVLGRLGLVPLLAGGRFRGLGYHGYGRRLTAPFPASPDLGRARGEGAPGFGLGLRRLVLDALLFARAAATPGVTAWQDARVEGPIIEGGRVRGVRVGGLERRARLVVGADGPRSPLRRKLGLDPRPPRHPRLGLRRHFRLAQGKSAADLVEIHLAPDHDLYVTPLAAGEISVALLVERDVVSGDADQHFARALAAHPTVQTLLEGATTTSDLGGRTPLGLRARRGVVPGLVLLGDAAGALDPVTGAGMAQALTSAELLAHMLVQPGRGFDPGDDVLDEFDRQRRGIYRDAAALAALLLTLVRHAPLAAGALRLLPHCPALLAHLVGVAAGTRRLVPG